MKTWKTIALLLCLILTATATVPNAHAGKGAKLQPCLDSDHCSSSGGACSASVSGCGSTGGCAYVSCTSRGCSGSCITSTNALGLPALFDESPNDPLRMEMHNSDFTAFMKHIRPMAPDGWSITSTARNARKTAVTAPLGAAEGTWTTARVALEDAALVYGVCVTINEKAKTITFADCAR